MQDIDFPADQTTILIDPPRKGCDDLFLQQLLAFNPACVVYVSCNVRALALASLDATPSIIC